MNHRRLDTRYLTVVRSRRPVILLTDVRTFSPLMPQSPSAGIISANMVLSANALVAGSRYTFSLTAAYVPDGRRRRLQDEDATDASSASISVLVNTPPSGGSFEVSPTTGERQRVASALVVGKSSLCGTVKQPNRNHWIPIYVYDLVGLEIRLLVVVVHWYYGGLSPRIGVSDVVSRERGFMIMLSCTPTFILTGIALTDVFELTTYAWEDDVADLPLTYVFAYVSGSANETDTSNEMVFRAALESSKATDVYLPQVL